MKRTVTRSQLGNCVKVEVDVLGSPPLIVVLVSVDESNIRKGFSIRSQELCETRGGPVLGSPSVRSLRS